MKLTRQRLNELIKQVIKENKKNSMILTEGDKKSKYKKIIEILEGKIATVDTVGIMSGQNPMVRPVRDFENKNRKAMLEKRLKEVGLSFIRIGAVFGNLPEQSVLVLDSTQLQMDMLCREFQQWGFVWGEKAHPYTEEQQPYMVFSMQVIDYENDMGWYRDPDSKTTAIVIKDDQLKGQTSDYSVDPTSGKKFGLDLYEEE
tara:strand:- start:81 stop:683 length:603 start_codon:yes stop_codon:yes gene_type:complete